MFVNTLILLGVGHVASTLAAIAFDDPPTSAQVGHPTTLKWSGSDDAEPVILTLYKGARLDLENGSNLTTDATGNTYIWNPSKDLADGDDYAIRIKQGGEINYTGLIALSGGTASGSSSALSASSTASSSASVKSAPAVIGGGSKTSAASNSTTPIMTSASNSSMTAVGSAVTGASMSRNKTMSMATLSSTASSAQSHPTSTSSISSTGGSSSPSPSSRSGAVELASNFALVLAGVVAVVYMG